MVYTASLFSFQFPVNLLWALALLSFPECLSFYASAPSHVPFSPPPTPFHPAKSSSSSRFQLTCHLLLEAFLSSLHLY